MCVVVWPSFECVKFSQNQFNNSTWTVCTLKVYGQCRQRIGVCKFFLLLFNDTWSRKDIQCHVWSYSHRCLQLVPEQITHHKAITPEHITHQKGKSTWWLSVASGACVYVYSLLWEPYYVHQMWYSLGGGCVLYCDPVSNGRNLHRSCLLIFRPFSTLITAFKVCGHCWQSVV